MSARVPSFGVYSHFTTLHREVATYSVTGECVGFTWTIIFFSLLQEQPWHMTFHQRIVHIGLQILHNLPYVLLKSSCPSDCISIIDLEALGPMVIVHIRHLCSSMFTCPMWAVFSLFYWICGNLRVASGRTRLKPLTTRSPSNIILVLWNSRSDGIEALFSVFYNYFGFGCWGLSFTERFALDTIRECIQDPCWITIHFGSPILLLVHVPIPPHGHLPILLPVPVPVPIHVLLPVPPHGPVPILCCDFWIISIYLTSCWLTCKILSCNFVP